MAKRMFQSAEEHMDYLRSLSFEEYEIEFQNHLNEEKDAPDFDLQKCIIKHDCIIDEYRKKHNLTRQDDVFNEIMSDSKRIISLNKK